jgi:hypothetical protein
VGENRPFGPATGATREVPLRFSLNIAQSPPAPPIPRKVSWAWRCAGLRAADVANRRTELTRIVAPRRPFESKPKLYGLTDGLPIHCASLLALLPFGRGRFMAPVSLGVRRGTRVFT